MRNKYIIVILLGFFSFITACATVDLNGLDPDDFQGQIDDGGGDGNNLFADVDCDSIDSSFTTQVKPFFDTNCATSGCHTGSNPAGSVQLDATNTFTPSSISSEITSGPGYDAFNVHQSSILLTALADNAGGDASNHTGGEIFSDVDDSDLEKIYCWLEGGLENDDDTDHNFGDDIRPLFTNCQGGGCHSNVAGRLNLNNSLSILQIYTNITSVDGNPQDNAMDPNNGPFVIANNANSLIYTQPTNSNGGDTHGGGEIFNTSTSQAQAILDWINNGAPFD